MGRVVSGPVALALSAAIAVAAAGCGSWLPAPRYFSEEPPDSRHWVEVTGVPAWVSEPPARDGMLRWVLQGKSNDRNVASARRGLDRQVRKRIESALAPVVGAEDAAQAALAATTATVLVHRVSRDEVLTRALDAGNTLSTVWTLCEVPLDSVVEALPAEQRAAARDALAR